MREEYLIRLLPFEESEASKKYSVRFAQEAGYIGNGVYIWLGISSSCSRNLWLMGVLTLEGINYRSE